MQNAKGKMQKDRCAWFYISHFAFCISRSWSAKHRMLDRPVDILGFQHDRLEPARIVAGVDAPGWPEPGGVAAAELRRLVDVAVQRQRRRVLLHKRAQRPAAHVLAARHLVER